MAPRPRRHPSGQVVVLALALAGVGDPVAAQDLLDGLETGHPRLVLHPDRQRNVEWWAETETIIQDGAERAAEAGEAALDLGPLPRELVDGRLTEVAEELRRRVYALGLSWRVLGEARFAEAMEELLLGVCAWPDWNPERFTDTAAVCHAVAIGYDWCFEAFDPQSRETIRIGLVEKGLRPGLAALDATPPPTWARGAGTETLLCYRGLVLGALAVAEIETALAERILRHAHAELPAALASFDPDGSWPEGLGSWERAVSAAVDIFAGLRTCLGHDLGLSQRGGIGRTAYFLRAATGPTGRLSTYADTPGDLRRTPVPALLWLGERFTDRTLVESEWRVMADQPVEIEQLMFFTPAEYWDEFTDSEVRPIPLGARFDGELPMAFFRSHEDDDALWASFKGGRNGAPHAHLDLGSFEFEARGVRWALDLGGDDPRLPGYHDAGPDGDRWDLYRVSSRSHNVLRLDDTDQATDARARITAFDAEADSAPWDGHAVLEFEGAWPGRASRVRRGLALVQQRRALLVQDELELTQPATLSWGMTTGARIELDPEHPSVARLHQDDELLRAVIVEPAGAEWVVGSAEQRPPQAPNLGVKRLQVHVPAEAGPVRLVVLLAPRLGPFDPERAIPAVVPLDGW